MQITFNYQYFPLIQMQLTIKDWLIEIFLKGLEGQKGKIEE